MVYATVASGKHGDPDEQLVYRDMPTPLGEMRLVASAKACAGRGSPTRRCCLRPKAGCATNRIRSWNRAARAGGVVRQDRRVFEVALDPVGTPFQHEVWRALCALDFGVLTSYGELARTVGRPKGAQAIGGAVGRNPLIIIIPCHRVIGSDTSLTGFGGGLPRRRCWRTRAICT